MTFILYFLDSSKGDRPNKFNWFLTGRNIGDFRFVTFAPSSNAHKYFFTEINRVYQVTVQFGTRCIELIILDV